MEEHTVDTLLFKNNKLQQETESLRDALGKLQLDNSSLSKECSSWKGRYEKVRSEFAQERVKSAEQELKMASLRSMLIPKTEVQLSDNEVVARFASLRSQILKLIKTVWSPVNFVPKADVSAEQYNFKILYTFVEGKVDMRYMDNLLRGVVFSILNEHVFSVRHYPIDTKNESLGEALSYAESYMFDKLPKGNNTYTYRPVQGLWLYDSSIRHSANDSTDSHASVIDWRMASMKATAAFKDDATILARTAFNTVVSFFQIFETTDAKATQGKKLLKNICKDAVALSMMMRNAKDEYCVDMLGHAMNKPASEWGELVEEEDSHPAANTEQPDTIAYFMTGALVKLPYGNAENIKVLEKAQAVVFSRPGNKKV